MQPQRKGTIAVLLAASLWGFWPVWVRGVAGGAATAAIAQAVGGLVTLPFALAAWRKRRALAKLVDRRDVVGVVILAAFNAANTWCYFRAISEGRIAPGVLAHYLAPVMVALAAPRLLAEPRGRYTMAALALSLAGTACVLLGSGKLSLDGAAARAFALGAASAVFYAGATITAKRAGRIFADVELYCYQAIIAGAAALALTTLPAMGSAWLRPSVGAIVSGAIPGAIFYVGLRRLPAERVGVLATWEVVAATLVGWAIFGEAPGWTALVGGAAILTSGWLATRSPIPPSS